MNQDEFVKMEKELEDLKDDLKIDHTNLEKEWLYFPDTYMKYCRLLTNATRDRDFEKDRLANLINKYDQEIRENPSSWGINKPTEDAIKGAVMAQDDVQDLKKSCIDHDYLVNMLFGVKGAMESKKTALEYLAKMMLSGLYSPPSLPADPEISRKLNKRMNERNRDE